MEEYKDCPYCGEKIKKEAIKCRFCGEWLNESKNEDEDKEEKNKIEKNYNNKNFLYFFVITIFIGIILSLIGYYKLNSNFFVTYTILGTLLIIFTSFLIKGIIITINNKQEYISKEKKELYNSINNFYDKLKNLRLKDIITYIFILLIGFFLFYSFIIEKNTYADPYNTNILISFLRSEPYSCNNIVRNDKKFAGKCVKDILNKKEKYIYDNKNEFEFKKLIKLTLSSEEEINKLFKNNLSSYKITNDYSDLKIKLFKRSLFETKIIWKNNNSKNLKKCSRSIESNIYSINIKNLLKNNCITHFIKYYTKFRKNSVIMDEFNKYKINWELVKEHN